MRKWYLFLLIFFLPILLQAAETKIFLNEHDQKIVTDYYSSAASSQEQLIIISPGYAQHGGTHSMISLANTLTAYADVLVISYRGNGRSEGAYTFGAHEINDLISVLDWARLNYNDITLIGFSIGAYTAYQACAEYPLGINRAYLVSCPTSVEDIVLSGAAFFNPIIILFRQVDYQIKPENDILFRWDWPFIEKTNLKNLGPKVMIPCHFLVAGQDTLVYHDLTQKVYQATAGEKTLTVFEDGIHAEHMYLQYPDRFLQWFTRYYNVPDNK